MRRWGRGVCSAPNNHAAGWSDIETLILHADSRTRCRCDSRSCSTFGGTTTTLRRGGTALVRPLPCSGRPSRLLRWASAALLEGTTGVDHLLAYGLMAGGAWLALIALQLLFDRADGKKPDSAAMTGEIRTGGYRIGLVGAVVAALADADHPDRLPLPPGDPDVHPLDQAHQARRSQVGRRLLRQLHRTAHHRSVQARRLPAPRHRRHLRGTVLAPPLRSGHVESQGSRHCLGRRDAVGLRGALRHVLTGRRRPGRLPAGLPQHRHHHDRHRRFRHDRRPGGCLPRLPHDPRRERLPHAADLAVCHLTGRRRCPLLHDLRSDRRHLHPCHGHLVRHRRPELPGECRPRSGLHHSRERMEDPRLQHPLLPGRPPDGVASTRSRQRSSTALQPGSGS